MKFKKLLALVIVPFVLSGCKTIKENDINKYQKLLKDSRNLDDFHTELYIFPDEIEVERVKDFSYQSTESLFTGSYLFYLSYQWGDDYEEEINRLSQIKAVFKGKGEKKILHYEKQKTFVTIYNEDGCRYEFAKYDSEKKMINYVSNQIYPWDKIGLEEPEKITIPEELLDWKEFYNMYYFYIDEIGYYVEEQ